MKERIVSLDIAKGICIVLVALGHYMPENAPHWYTVMYDVMHTFRMPLFLFASGYIYIATKKDIGYGAFILKKIKRLFVPYLATSIVVITFKLLTQGRAYVENPVSALSYVRMLYQPEAGEFLWFLWALMWMFVIIPFFKKRESRLVLFVITLILHILPMHITGMFCLNQLKAMFVYFVAGVVSYEYVFMRNFVVNFNKFKSIYVISVFAIVSGILVATNNLHNGIMLGGATYACVLNIVLPFIGIMFILEISKLLERVKSGRLLKAVLMTAASSYTIYLFHTTFMGLTKAFCMRLHFDTDLWYVFVFEAIFVTFVGVAIPMVLDRCVLRKFAVTRFLFGL